MSETSKQLWGFCESCHCQQIATCQDCKKSLREARGEEGAALTADNRLGEAEMTLRMVQNRLDMIQLKTHDADNPKPCICAVCLIEDLIKSYFRKYEGEQNL